MGRDRTACSQFDDTIECRGQAEGAACAAAIPTTPTIEKTALITPTTPTIDVNPVFRRICVSPMAPKTPTTLLLGVVPRISTVGVRGLGASDPDNRHYPYTHVTWNYPYTQHTQHR
jgi:hypothetical protein